MRYRSFKRYGHEVGFSCCFRQWRADSHCALLHGYALAVTLEFGAATLDSRNWVEDFGGLKRAKDFLTNLLDHTLLVAEDDPQAAELWHLDTLGLADVRALPSVGCEALAEHIHTNVVRLLGLSAIGRVQLLSVRIDEHGANGAAYHYEAP